MDGKGAVATALSPVEHSHQQMGGKLVRLLPILLEGGGWGVFFLCFVCWFVFPSYDCVPFTQVQIVQFIQSAYEGHPGRVCLVFPGFWVKDQAGLVIEPSPYCCH